MRHRTICGLLSAVVGVALAVPAEAQDRVEQVTMRDGTKLKANVWFPGGTGPWPVVLQRFYQAGSFPFGRDRFLAAGYATVHHEIRDANGTIGTRFTRDDLDGYDTVGWVAGQSWCNGQVAMYGKSAGGITAFAAATARPPALKAIIPMNNGETWRWGYRANGAVTLAMAANSRAIPSIRNAPWDTDRNAYKFLPVIDLDLHARGSENPLWNQMVENNEWNAFYAGKRLKVENIQIPTFIIGGWWDYYAGSAFRYWSTIKQANPSKDIRVLIGATNHVSQFPPDGRSYPGGREDAAGEAVRWLDYVIKGKQNGVGGEPPIKVFTMGANKWQRYSSWPPAAQGTKFHLRNAEKDRFGTLETTPPGNEPASEYDYDPDNPAPTLGGNHSIWFYHKLVPVGSFDHGAHEQRSDVLVFSTPPLATDTEITGPVAVTFWAASDARDTDWTGILLDVQPDGKPYNVTMGILRARYRKGIFKAPQLLTPGTVEQYSLELMPTSHTFKQGHRIRLYLSSSNFPLWDRNPNTGGEIHLETKTQVAHQTIYHDSSRPSHLLLPLVSGGGSGSQAPSITSSPVTTAQVGKAYRTDVNGAGIPAPTFSLSKSPSGMTIDAATGVIGWTPSAAGSFDVTVTASNGVSPDAAQSFTITVTDPGGGQGTLPGGWKNQDVGSVGVPGNASTAAGTFTVQASGADIWGTADGFHFVYLPLSGDGEIRARVASQEPVHPWAKAGVMIRESLSPGSPHAMAVVTPQNGTRFERRTAPDGISQDTAGPAAGVPVTVRVVRTGNVLTGYASTDGSPWTQLGTETIPMAADVYLGLAATSHDNGILYTTTFDSVVVVSLIDTDGDGMSDLAETAAGFDPADSDQDLNGIPDGRDDWDGDGVNNQTELAAGTPPGSPPAPGPGPGPGPGPAPTGGSGGSNGGCGALGLDMIAFLAVLLAVRRIEFLKRIHVSRTLSK